MQYCVILDVDSLTEATALGIDLQRLGYKIVCAQVKPSRCPVQPCESCSPGSFVAAGEWLAGADHHKGETP